MPSDRNRGRRRECGRWVTTRTVPVIGFHHSEMSSNEACVDRRNLLALRVVAGLENASAALAARRSVVADTAALAPDSHALKVGSQ